QCRAMSNRHFRLENRRMRSMTHVNHRIVLDVGPVADANVMNIAANRAVTPDRSLFAEVYVTYNLSTGFDIRGWVNLRVNPSKRSNHGFGEIVTFLSFVLSVLYLVLGKYKALTCAKLRA